MSDDLLAIFDDDSRPPNTGEPWHILIVDDEPQVHRVTRLALDGFEFRGRQLQYYDAHSAAEAIDILESSPFIALILLDVVMESESAGFDVIRYVRETLNNPNMRIILRTGQAGQAPAKDVVRKYDINDYHNKTDLTAEKMFISIYTALVMFEQLESLARKTQLLANAYRDIEQLVHITSHDLQEPLLSITSLSAQLRKSNLDKLDDTGRKCIGFMDDAVQHMREMVADLLDHSQIVKLQEPEVFTVNELIDELKIDLAVLLEESSARIECTGNASIYAQRTKIKMLLQNLLSNSIKYRKPGTGLNIGIETIVKNSDIEIRVSDDGIGIDPAYHETVFNVFKRLHNKKDIEGTGIGLAHCKKIANLHGGSIRIESEPGKGTTVICSLPHAVA